MVIWILALFGQAWELSIKMPLRQDMYDKRPVTWQSTTQNAFRLLSS